MFKHILRKIANSVLHSKRPHYRGGSSNRYHRPGPLKHSSSYSSGRGNSYGHQYYKKKFYSSS
ncbi:hypothetical protein [Paenibacillus sp. EPM92]|uniref:hypothetical protein n=1 Tax=Paenibacillus sp. EPM92 TaxID=1561195 RepID=UPI00191560BA|nr:hypothetical protein [Paenibacillus sp. EPM92]